MLKSWLPFIPLCLLRIKEHVLAENAVYSPLIHTQVLTDQRETQGKLTEWGAVRPETKVETLRWQQAAWILLGSEFPHSSHLPGEEGSILQADVCVCLLCILKNKCSISTAIITSLGHFHTGNMKYAISR